MDTSVAKEVSREIGDAAEDAAAQLKYGIEHGAEQARAAISEAAAALSKAAHALAEAARKQARVGSYGAMQELKEHPLAASIALVAAVTLVGCLALRRR